MGEELKVSYSFDYLKEVFNYILVPVFIVLLIVVVGLVIYAKKEKDHTTEKYNYTMNFWSYLMCIILSAALFAIALSFVVSLHNSIAGRPVDKSNLIYIVYLSPIIPLIFLISTGIHWIKMFLAYKNRRDNESIEENNNDETPEEENDESFDNSENDIENNTAEIEDVPEDKDTAPIPVTPNKPETEEIEDTSESPIPIVVEEKPIEKTDIEPTSEKENNTEETNNDEERENPIVNDIENNETLEDNENNDSNVEDLEENKKKETEESDIEVLDID